VDPVDGWLPKRFSDQGSVNQTNLAEGIIMALYKREEIERNLERFMEELPGLVRDHNGQYALNRHGEIKAFFDSPLDAQIAGNRQFDDEMFSIQHVKEAAEELGYFSYAVDSGHP
jgi:hypothetical protein